MKEQRKVYFVMETVINEQGHYIPCIAVEGETGYYKTDWSWDCSLEMAEQLCQEKNDIMGIDAKTAALIQLGTMRPIQ